MQKKSSESTATGSEGGTKWPPGRKLEEWSTTGEKREADPGSWSIHLQTHHHTKQQSALASTCLFVPMLSFYITLCSNSPSLPEACCQSTLHWSWLVRWDFVLDRLIQLVRQCRTKCSWAAVVPPTRTLSCLGFLDYTQKHTVQVENVPVYPSLFVGSKKRGNDCSIYVREAIYTSE